jgi:hypothetical protein
MSFDPKCHELAEYFLDDDPKPATANADELAQLIQGTIEDYLHVSEPEPAGSRDRDEWKHEAAAQQRLK